MEAPGFMKSIRLLGVLLALALGTRASASDAVKPNIVLILADDIGISGVSGYGGQHKTPHVDALAKEGTRFEYCFAAPLCAPSRALLMTGRYPFRTGVLDNNSGGKMTPKSETIIARTLKDVGYITGFAGKWHQLGYMETVEEAKSWGFDEFLAWNGKKDGERYWAPHYNKNGKTLVGGDKDYGPDMLHKFAIDFITRHKDKPFFFYYPMVSIHAPILRTPDTPESGKHLFADNVAYMDKLIGKLIAELDRLKLLEKTLVVFVGDNGTIDGGRVDGKKVDGGKGTMKEGGSRVPCVISWKGTTPASVVSKDLIDFSDFYPTLAEVAGAKLPAAVTIDGRSFAAQLRGQEGERRDWVYVELGQKRYVRDARWKLTGDGILSDMQEAPFGELAVEAGKEDSEAAAARKRLQAVLEQLK
jgi:arylsulfatase A